MSSNKPILYLIVRIRIFQISKIQLIGHRVYIMVNFFNPLENYGNKKMIFYHY